MNVSFVLIEWFKFNILVDKGCGCVSFKKMDDVKTKTIVCVLGDFV